MDMQRAIIIAKAIAVQFDKSWIIESPHQEDDQYTLDRVEDNEIFIYREYESGGDIVKQVFVIRISDIGVLEIK